MFRMITGSLQPTASYSRREYAYLNYGPDGRDGTVFLNHWHSNRRHNTAVYSSRYSVGEVHKVGWAGRCFVFDKEMGQDEHGERKPGDRQPPYEVLTREYVGPDGEVSTVANCQCMGATCNAPTCRHADLVRELLEQGAFDGEENGYSEGSATTQTSYDASRVCGHSRQGGEVPTGRRGNSGVLTSPDQPMDDRQDFHSCRSSHAHSCNAQAEKVIQYSGISG